MKKSKAYALCLIFSFSLLFFYQNVFAQTDINGDIISTDTTWTKDAGPYVIYQSPTIEASTTLTIEPGTIIKSDFLEGINVYGKIIVNGTSAEKIYLTSLYDDSIGGDTDGDGGILIPTAGDWEGINVLDGGTYEINNSEIYYAFIGVNSEESSGTLDFVGIFNSTYGVDLYDSSLVANNIDIENIDSNAINIQSTSTATIQNSSIKNIGNYGVSVGYGSNLIFDSSNIENILGTNNEALDVRNNSYIKVLSSNIINVFNGANVYENSRMDFIDSRIDGVVQDTQASAFYVYNNSELNISSSTVNDIYGNYAIAIFNNGKVIASSSKFSNFYGYYAFDIYFNGGGYATSSLDVNDSEVINGDVGFYVWGGANLNIKNTRISNFWESGIYTYKNPGIVIDNSEITNNYVGIESYRSNLEIKNSIIKDNTSFGIYAETVSVKAINNWWGDAAGPFNAVLNASGTANQVSSKVDFIPWLTADPKIEKRNPVIIVPGIMGTQLLKNYGDNSEIWPNISGLLTSYTDSFLDDLALNVDGSENPDFPMVVGDVMRKVELAGNTVLDTWEGMIDTLTAGGYTEGVDLFVFPYDWRKSNTEDAGLLKNKIDEIVIQTGSEKVDILAHSMGGLVAQEYIAENGSNKVDKLFFIGTPHLGAPKAFKALMYGDDMGINKVRLSILSPSEVKVMSQNFSSVFGLLPSIGYINLGNKYIYDTTGTSSKWLSYNETKDFMASRSVNTPLFSQAEILHSNIDGFNLSDADVYNFVGCGTTKTIGSITLKKKKSWTSLWQKIVDDYSLDYVNGDDTVPLISSIGPFGNHNYYIKNSAHSELPSTSGVPDTILSLLLGTSTPSLPNVSTSSDSCDITGRVVSVHSPVTMDIYDEIGNHTGATSTGGIEYDIPGVNYDLIEGDAFAFLPQSGSYKIIIKATDTGAYNFYVNEIDNNDEKIGQSYWSDIPLNNLLSSFQLDISSTTSSYLIMIDEDGDGIFESSSSPSAILEPSNLNDRTSPQTTASVSSDGMVTFSPMDDSAGVLKTEYTFDGNNWFVYSAQFLATGRGVEYFSTDRAGNVESAKKVTVPPSIIAPSITSKRSRSIITTTLDQNPASSFVVIEQLNIGQNNVEFSEQTELAIEVSAPIASITEDEFIGHNEKVAPEILAGIRLPTPDSNNSLSEIKQVATVNSSKIDVGPIVTIVSLVILATLVFVEKKYIIK